MTTATRPLADHGTYARANGSPGYRDGCNCELCRPVRLAAKKRNTVNRRLGRSARVDATPAREHLKLLRPTMGWKRLEAATGCTWHTLNLILTGRRTQISHHTLRKILAAKPAAIPDRGAYINATGSIRRIHAMQAEGHSYRAIAQAAGTCDARIQVVSAGPARVRQMLADKIARAYDELAHTPGTSARSRRTAAERGWRDAQYWDDMGHIDDPDFDPDVEEKVTRAEVIAEDATWLLETGGLDRDQTARRLGITRRHLERALREAAAREETAA